MKSRQPYEVYPNFPIISVRFDSPWEFFNWIFRNVKIQEPSTLRRRNLKTTFSLGLTHQIFSVHIMPEKFANATIIGYFGFVFQKKMGREIIRLSAVMPSFAKQRCQFFPSTLKYKAVVSKFLRFDECFHKASPA